MRLEGLLEESLGGFVCIRGYAPLGDLARISESDPDYQRNLIEEQREEIVHFLENKEYLFFPEVILSYTLKYDFATGVSGINPLRDILDRKKFASNVDGIRFNSTKSGVHKVIVDITESFLKSNTPFFRIDGNHRLSASQEKTTFNDYVTPFCLILFPEGNQSEEYKRVIFHNINSKSVPLTSEENLRLILDEDNIFSDEKLKTQPSFGVEFFLARKLKDSIDLHVLKHIANSFKQVKHNGDEIENKRTVLLKLFKLLLDKEAIEGNDEAINKVHSAIVAVNELYGKYAKLAACHSHALFIAFVYYELHLEKGDYRASFKNWVLYNHMYNVDDISPSNLVSVYDTILESRKRHIFVSMQFSDDTKNHYTAIKNAIDQVNQKHKLDLELKEIRIDEMNKGYSYTISDEILQLINNTGLLIADLTHGNRNVYHELGFLMGLNVGRDLKHNNFILLMKNDPNGKTDAQVGFNIRDFQQIRFNEAIEITARLVESLEVYYKLKPAGNEVEN
ncbi:hypothetical protein [Roseivirga seohaensis]|uniref:hypothetical protein n=1 Tax=Roseivirga seohaensis TaxID=1914963 RepID=UPI003BAA31D3